MKTLTSLTLTIFSVLAFSAAASAQAGGKVAVINTQAFGEAGTGITKYINALKTIETEFAPALREIESLDVRLKALEKEIEGLRASSSTADQQAGQRKVDEYQRLQQDRARKAEDARVRFNKRRTAVTAPLNESIGNALTEFAKKNGYAIVLDVSRDTAGVIVTIADEKADITRDFIAFFNARP